MRPTKPPTVGEYMTRDVVTLDENDSLENLLKTFESLRFRHLPVIDDGRLVGLISERELLRASASSLLPHKAEQDRFLTERFGVRDIMTRDVASVSADRTMREAGELMLRARYGCVPVVDAGNVLVGILTASDFIRAAIAWLE